MPIYAQAKMIHSIDAKHERWTLILFLLLMNIEQINRAFQDRGIVYEIPCIYFLHYSSHNVTQEYLGDDNQAIRQLCPGSGPARVNHGPFSGRPTAEPLSLGNPGLWMAWQLLWHVLFHMHVTCPWFDTSAVRTAIQMASYYLQTSLGETQ